MVAAVGISNLQYVDLNSSRNLFIFGFSTLMGLVVPRWVKTNPGAVSTGRFGCFILGGDSNHVHMYTLALLTLVLIN